MICAISRQEDANRQNLMGATQPLLSPGEPNLCDDFISKEHGYFDRFYLNFLRHCVFGYVLLDSDPVDDVDSWKEVLQPTKKPRSVEPTQIETKENNK